MDFHYLLRSRLFDGLTKEQIKELLPCLNAEVRSFKKDEFIYSSGKSVQRFGLILEGDVRIEHVDAWGRINLLTIMETGKTFAEAFAFCPGSILDTDFVAENDCTVLFLDAKCLATPCGNSCAHHVTVTQNVIKLLAQRNLELGRRAMIITARTIRAKAMGYLSLASHAYGTREFDIPYNREQLAEFLGVDRAALSAELSKMQNEGLIRFRKNHFVLLETNGEYE